MIPAKGFIASFAREQHRYVATGQFRNVVQGHGWRIADGLFHVPDQSRQGIPELLGCNCDLVVLCSEALCSKSGERALVGKTFAVESNRKSADSLARLRGRATKHNGRIDSSAQKEADGHITNHVLLNRLLDQ